MVWRGGERERAYLDGEAVCEEGKEPGEADRGEVDAQLGEMRRELRHAFLYVVEEHERARARGQQRRREEAVWEDALDERREHPERFFLVRVDQQQRRRDQVHALAVPDRGIASVRAADPSTEGQRQRKRGTTHRL